MEKKFYLLKIIFAFLFYSQLYSQEFTISPFITIPGNNFNFECDGTDIVWVNKLDSIYTIYIKRISFSEPNILVYSDVSEIANPQISRNRIFWENRAGAYWKILMRTFTNDSLGDITVMVDSIFNKPQMTVNNHRIGWIDNGMLIVKEFQNMTENIVIDSNYCSNPDLDKYGYDYKQGSQIIYQKSIDEHKEMFYAKQNRYQSDEWVILPFHTDREYSNTKYGLDGIITFQIKKDSIWRVGCGTNDYLWQLTSNETCNFENPSAFVYPIPSFGPNLHDSLTQMPYLLFFDSDSLKGNKEIFVKPFIYVTKDTLINVSNMEGNDFQPQVCDLRNGLNDGYVRVFWLHEENNKCDIWMGKTILLPNFGAVDSISLIPNKFHLFQNYPNPFNPTTKISYAIPPNVKGKRTNVEITIYDVLGKKITTLVNKEQSPGEYEVTFDGSKLASGIYFYVLRTDKNFLSRKMCLLK